MFLKKANWRINLPSLYSMRSFQKKAWNLLTFLSKFIEINEFLKPLHWRHYTVNFGQGSQESDVFEVGIKTEGRCSLDSILLVSLDIFSSRYLIERPIYPRECCWQCCIQSPSQVGYLCAPTMHLLDRIKGLSSHFRDFVRVPFGFWLTSHLYGDCT